jgi:uncharacterized protein (TIGR03084 family)
VADLEAIRRDLEAEHADLDGYVASLSDTEWDVVTPAEPWTIRHQIAHLAFFDDCARQAAADPNGFTEGLGGISDLDEYVNGPLRRADNRPPTETLEWWRKARASMLAIFSELDPASRIPWYGPPMSPASFMSARLMETWAHGQDVLDALGQKRAPTDRLRHIAHLGYRARRNSYAARGMEMPEGDVLVELAGPSGDTWTFGHSDTDRVSGPAEDFCLVVTQRRHPDDTGLVVEGELAREWIDIAQAFAGPPGDGRRPGQFAVR